MFYQIFISPQAKRCVIITYKHGIYELPHKLPNDLRRKEIRKYEESLKNSYNDSLVPSLPAKMKILLILAKISSKTEITFFP